MQKLLARKLALDIPRNLSSTSSSFLHSHPCKAFSSLTQTTPNHILTSSTAQQPTHFFFSRFTSPHSWLSQNSVSKKIYGVLSNPLLVKQFVSNTHSRVLSRSLMDCRVWFLRAQFSRKSFQFNPSFVSSRRGWRSWFSRLTASDVVLGLIIANAAVFLLWRIADPKFMTKHFTGGEAYSIWTVGVGFNPKGILMGLISLDNFKSGRVHTVITSAFSHAEVWHLVSNMIGLYFFGMNIGKVFGPEFLLKLYFAGAVGGSVFYLVHHAFMALSSKGQGLWGMDPSRTPGLGASGAVNAIMLLDIFLFPTSTLYLEFFIPVPAILLGIFLIGKDMLRIIEGDSQISGSAHLGGAVVAAIAWARVRKGRF